MSGIQVERDHSRLYCRSVLRVTAAVLATLIAGGSAADGPDAATQELLRQQDRERPAAATRENTGRSPRTRRASRLGRLPASEAPCFTIDSIELTGDASDRFQWALLAANETDDRALGRCRGSAGINLVMKRVQNAIIERGYITTRVLAQPQDLNSGTLTLTLIPGRIHSIRFAEGTSQRGTKWNAVPRARAIC